jgi:hypothetical protein
MRSITRTYGEPAVDNRSPYLAAPLALEEIVSLASERRQQLVAPLAARRRIGSVHAAGKLAVYQAVVLGIDPQRRLAGGLAEDTGGGNQGIRRAIDEQRALLPPLKSLQQTRRGVVG